MMDYSLVVEVDGAFESDESDVVVQVSWIVFRVDGHRHDVLFDVRIKLGLAVHVPLAESDAQVDRRVAVKTNPSY